MERKRSRDIRLGDRQETDLRRRSPERCVSRAKDEKKKNEFITRDISFVLYEFYFLFDNHLDDHDIFFVDSAPNTIRNNPLALKNSNFLMIQF